jgi:hypothetical protein
MLVGGAFTGEIDGADRRREFWYLARSRVTVRRRCGWNAVQLPVGDGMFTARADVDLQKC